MLTHVDQYIQAIFIHFHVFSQVDPCWPLLTHVDHGWPLLTHVDPFWFMLTHVDPCWHTLTHHVLLCTMMFNAFLWKVGVSELAGATKQLFLTHESIQEFQTWNSSGKITKKLMFFKQLIWCLGTHGMLKVHTISWTNMTYHPWGGCRGHAGINFNFVWSIKS